MNSSVTQLNNSYSSEVVTIADLLFSCKNATSNLNHIVKAAVSKIVSLKNLVGKTVFLKPNLTFVEPKSGVTTTISLIERIVIEFKELGCGVVIGEGDAGAYAWTTKDSWINHGLDEICRRHKISFIHLSDLKWDFLNYEYEGKKYKIEVIENFDNIADVTISLPVIKTHAMTGVSLSLKNLWGMVPSPMRLLQHENLEIHLGKLAEYYNLVGVIYDGLVSLDGNGPMYGEPKNTDVLLWTVNPISADILVTRMMELDPKSVSHIVCASEMANVSIQNLMSLDLPYIIGSFKPLKTKLNLLEYLTFKSNKLSRLVFISSFSSIIYRLFNLLKPANQRNSSPRNKFLRDDRRI